MSLIRANRLVESIRATQSVQDQLNRELESVIDLHFVEKEPDEAAKKRLIESLPECTARFNLWRKYLKG